MQVTVTDKDENNIATISFETEAGIAKDAYSKTLKGLAKDLTIKGFRKGKAPTKVVEDHFGAERVRAETVNNQFLSSLFDKVFKEQDLNVVNIPQVSKVEFDSPEAAIKVEAKIELFPEVTMADYAKFKLTVDVPKIDIDAQYADTLKRLTSQQAAYTESDKAIEISDEIILDFDGSFKNDAGEFEPKDGMKAEGFQTIVEPGRFIDNFLEQTVGMKAGDEKEIDVKFPDQYHDPELASRDAKFKVKIQKVSKAAAPEMNDDFAKNFGIETMDELSTKITEEVTKLSEQTRKGITSEAIITELHAQSTVNISEAMVSRELENDVATLQYQNKWDEEQVKDYLSSMDREAEMAKAREKLEKSILITTIIREQKMEVGEDEIRAEISKLNFPPDMDSSKIDMEALVNRLNLDLLTQKAVDLLIEAADIQYNEVEGHIHTADCNH
ncbi:MAG: trigger factor [Candidatus Melainabacteria bacterium]|jgi:trigger factor|nr:trigger factor [Candidatus Melainabacteria bacterium]